MGAVTKEPKFPGEAKALANFINKNITIPIDSSGNVRPDKTYVMFMIRKDGAIMDVTTVKGGKACPDCKSAAMEVVKKMPKWVSCRK